MIKTDVLRKNLITGEISEGPVDSIFEAINKRGGPIMQEHPFIEIQLGIEDATAWKTAEVVKAKAAKIIEIKQEAARRINALYPQYKQNNLIAEVIQVQNQELIALKAGSIYNLTDSDIYLLNTAKTCKDFVTLIRIRSDIAEQTINDIDTQDVNTINSFDVTNNVIWDN